MEIKPDSQPLSIFDEWMNDAVQAGMIEPTAMTLATVDEACEVHARVVLCKSWSEDGFTFYTSYQSQKGRDLAAHARAAAVFFWDKLGRQVRVTGAVEKTSRQASMIYWDSRPRESQLSQHISKQSSPAPSREALDSAWRAAEQEFKDKEIPCPEHWGGYLIRPKAIEFWIGRPGRLHDRHTFEKSKNGWTYLRLYP